MQKQINRIYKKASSRLKLLQRIRPNITPHAAEKIKSAVIRPILLYCYPVYISLGDTTKSKLQSIQDRAHKIVAKKEHILEMGQPRTDAKETIHIFMSVSGICTESRKNMFKKFDHGKNTRGNGCLLILPKVRSEAGRTTFAFRGASI